MVARNLTFATALITVLCIAVLSDIFVRLLLC